MRKILLFSLMAVMLIPAALGQMTATIGSTASSPSSYQLPWNHYYGYSETQYGIPASDLTALGSYPATITKIGWHNYQDPPTSNYSLNVYIDQVSSAYDLSDLCTSQYANTNVAATGKLLTGGGAGTIYSLTLDTPFVYTPGNALIISVCDTTAGYQYPYSTWSGNSFSGNGISRYSDSVVYDCNLATSDGGSTACTNMWMTTWFEFTSSASSYNLTMLTPGGAGTGTVAPAPGTYSYLEDAIVTISASPNVGYLFDYWELDGAFYSNDENESVLMNANHTVQGFFKPFAALALPFVEDFTGVATGDIPANWDRTYNNWGAVATSNAGGVSPEMRLYYSPWVYDQIKLITPKLDGTAATQIACSFKHYIDWWSNSFDLIVQTSIDNGATWQNRWFQTVTSDFGGEVIVNLDAVAGNEFQIAFVFDGDTDDLFYWYIDDIYVGAPPTMWELDMLNPVGQGGVIPGVGLHDMIVDGTEITLAAIPSSTWYAFDIFEDFSFAFDPMTPGISNFIADMPTADFISAGTWADGDWYVTDIADSSNLYIVNTATGDLTFIGTTGYQFVGIAYDEVNDIMYGHAGSGLYQIDRTTATATLLTSLSQTYVDIAYGDGVLYGHNLVNDAIYAINVSTGSHTLICSTGFIANYSQGMEYDKDHGRLFLSLFDYNDFLSYLVEIDLASQTAINWGIFNDGDVTEIDGFAIPYGIVHPWEFDRWEVDGVFYSNNPITTLVMNDDHTAQAFFIFPDPSNCAADPAEIYPYDSVELTADSAFEIHWFDDVCGGNEIGVGSPLTVNPLVTTTYYARAYDAVGNEWSDGCCDVVVTVLSLPIPDDPTDCNADPAEICVGDDALLTADSAFEIHWFDDECGGNEIGVGLALNVNPLVTTTYYARAYDPIEDEWSDGCCDVEVMVHELPVATASNNSTAIDPLEEGDDLELAGGPDGMDYYWEGPNAWTSTDQNPTRTDVNESMAGVYTLTVTDANGCEGSAATTVYIGEPPPPPPIPTMGVTGIGLLLLALGSLISFARRRK